jgi:hypothetical protein
MPNMTTSFPYIIAVIAVLCAFLLRFVYRAAKRWSSLTIPERATASAISVVSIAFLVFFVVWAGRDPSFVRTCTALHLQFALLGAIGLPMSTSATSKRK